MDLGNVAGAVGVGRVVGVGHIDRRISRLEARIGYSKIGNLRMSLDLIAGGLFSIYQNDADIDRSSNSRLQRPDQRKELI